jgi:(p)ppGpp synthase/HD superfamily hydrolase
VRKGTSIPYLAHVLAVTALVLEDGGDEDEAIAGLLHDVLEDQPGRVTRGDIGRRFGERVAQIVEECSVDGEGLTWRERKERYIDRMRQATSSVRRVSLADKVHNARAILADFRQIGEAVWSRFNASKDEVFWYYRALLVAYRVKGTGFLLEELERTVAELTDLANATPGAAV